MDAILGLFVGAGIFFAGVWIGRWVYRSGYKDGQLDAR